MAQVILENRTGARFEATMYHDVVCRRAKKCFCTVNPKALRGVERRKFPSSFSIDIGAKSAPLPVEVLFIQAVMTAVKRGSAGGLIRHDMAEPVAALAKPKAPPTPAKPAKTKGGVA